MARDLFQEAGLVQSDKGVDLFESFGVEPPKRGVLDTIKQGIGAVVEDVSGGLERKKKRDREEEMARANALNDTTLRNQQRAGSADELQAMADSDANAVKYRESAGETVGTAGNFARDMALGGVKGAANTLVKLPLALQGVALDASGAREAAEGLGLRNKEAQQGVDAFGKWTDSLKSDAGKTRDAIFEGAKGFTETLMTVGTSPAMLADKIAESLVGTAVVGKVAGAAVQQFLPKFVAQAEAAGLVGKAAEEFIADKALKVAIASAAVGEGAQAGLDIAGTAQAAGRTIGQYGMPALAGGVATAVIGAASGGVARKMGVGDIETDIAMKGVAGGAKTDKGFIVNRAAVEGFKEGALEEMPQSTSEAAMENLAMGRPWDSGLGKAAATGLATGFGMGAGHAAASRGDAQQSAEVVASSGSAPAGAAPAADILGADSPFANSEQPKTEAEKALYTPKSLTALDRSAEIDKLIEPKVQAWANATDDQDRAAKRAEVDALLEEQNKIKATWPASVTGANTSFSTESGARLDANYALMESGDLTTSHDENLRATPEYPAELQPRERERAASEMQVSGIVQKLDPARLGLSADAATGAPIVGADGLVESGNARTIALKRVYQANGQKAVDYKQYLKDNAAQFGITPESVDAMQKPVLVRVRSTPVNRAEFARQANASTTAQMSQGEQAKSDAARMDVMDDLRPDENGDFTNSREFIRRFMAKLPGTEQAGMIDSAGNLSQAGYARIRNAVLAKAYGDSPTLARLVESLDDNLRNVGKALVAAAPAVAKARQSVAEGALFDADITPDLMAAVEELSRIKDSGQSVAEAMSQAGMFGERYSPETHDLLQFLADNLRRPRVMAEFIQNYMQALTAAGNPNQGSIFGDATAPTKGDLINVAKGKNDVAENTVRRDAGKDEGAGAESGGRPANAQGGSRSTQGDEAANVEIDQQWQMFGPETGTLGIPRANMPQVAIRLRPAMLAFLETQGVGHVREDVAADELKPTQAEYSTVKTERASTIAEDRSDASAVLVSSDGYVLDGHHRWLAKAQAHQPINVIRFDAPIDRLLDVVREFSGVTTSNGSPELAEKRTQAVERFYDAAGDLAQILSKHTRAAIVPEDMPNLMPTLVKLFDAAFDVVGTDTKRSLAWVKSRLKAMPEFRTLWNKILPETYRKAALKAVESYDPNKQTKGQSDLFGDSAKPQAKQLDLLSGSAPKVAMIDGRPYDNGRDNYKPFGVEKFMTPEALVDVDAAIEKYYKDKPDPIISAEDSARAESLLKPALEKAVSAKAEYDQKIIDIAKKAGAIGQMLADVKGLARAVPKLVNEAAFNVGKIKDLLRSTIIISSYDDAQAVVELIEKDFDVVRIKNLTDFVVRSDHLAEAEKLPESGYRNVLINVRLPSGTIAEIQINTPAMMSAKYNQGHKLYEVERDLPEGNETRVAVEAIERSLYAAAANFDIAQAGGLETKSPERGSDLTSSKPSSSPGMSPENINTLPLGKRTKSSPPEETTNSQPAGNLSGTFISSTSNTSIANSNDNGYTGSEDKSIGKNDENGKSRAGGAQRKESGALFADGESGNADGVRSGSGRGNKRADRDAGASDRVETGVLQAAVQGSDGTGRDNEHGRQDGKRDRAVRNAGIPAGRDIPAKSGRNYAFGDGDLTYAGSWHTKARQNVDAVELLKKLQSEKRQATRDEQAILAKFIGWGSSEMANTLFGNKLDKQLELISQYEQAAKYFESNSAVYQRGAGFYQAFNVLKAKDDSLQYYAKNSITKAELEAAKPDMSVRKWADLRDRLKAALTEEEWAAASRSTQYAHYTSKPIVRALLGAVEKMGFKGGTILEPGAGIGVFPGLMNSAMATNSIYTGIEFEPVTGGILQQLFPDERILVESFVDSKLPGDYYDVAFGNPPFGGFKVLGDPKYAKLSLALHDYFFAKTIDSVKPGGLVVFVTSRYTMDKAGDKARNYMAERADLVGAIRLPQTAFQKNAGTEVVTDVLFLRKKVAGQTFEHAQAWAGLDEVKTDKAPALVNEYFAAHPEMVLGTHARAGSMYSKDEYTVLPNDGDIEAQFVKATENLPPDVFVVGRGSAAEAAKVRDLDFNPKAKKEGSFYVTDAGVLMQREGGVGVRAEEKHQKNAALIKDYVGLRDAVKQSQFDQLSDGDWESSLKTLQKAYAAFVKKNGRLFQNTTYMQKIKVDELDDDGTPTGNKVDDEEARYRFPVQAKLRDDPEYTLVNALEVFNEDTGEITDSGWLTKRTLGAPDKADIQTPADALLASLNDTGKVDIGAIGDMLGLSDQEAIDSLGSMVFDDPAQGWQMADEYLSGNVKSKLEAAEEAAKSDKRYERNIEALKAVQPTPRAPADITPQIGMNWIPGEVYAQFLQELAGVKATIEYVQRSREWVLTAHSGFDSPRATVDWGVSKKENAAWLLEKSLTGAPIRLNSDVPDGKGGFTKVFDADRTEAAMQKRLAMRDEFRKWLFQDATRAADMVRRCNDKFNTTVQRKFDGRHLTLPGTSKLFNIFDHVKRGAWRVIQSGNTYLAHAVGSGKTFEMVISAMEQKRLGLIKKPMIIVPGHMLQQFASEWQQLYPTARLMVANEQDFHTDNRRKFVSRVAMSDLDGVIMTHSSFKLLDLDPAFKQTMIEQELEYMRAAYEEAGGDLDDVGNKKVRKEPKIKRIEAQIERLEQDLLKSTSSEGKDKNVRFDEMGVDFLYVDEAHLFRKLSFATNRQMKGIDPSGSQMSWDLFMKTRWLAQKNPNRNLVMASGTPITNTTAELYTVQRFMAPQALEENGLERFDDWAAQFGEESTTIESTSSGKYEPVTRFQNFVNVGEMTQMFRDFTDVLNEDHLAALLGDKRPKVAGGSRKLVITPKTPSYVAFQDQDLKPRIEASKRWKPSIQDPYNNDPLININTDARLAAIDMRFMEPSLPSDPDSKLNQLIDGVIRVYKETEGNEYKDKQGNIEPLKGAAQMVFFETGFGRQAAINRGFSARAWMEKRLRDAGIPVGQLAFMEDYKKSTAKLKLFKEVNSGKVRILVGSSGAMGTGVNAQQRLIAMHHMDAPMVPAVLEQREGRIVRQGNKNPLVQIYAYAMRGSFDENQWGMLARKKFFIEQAMSGDPNIRSIEDVGEVSQMEIAAALVAENPFVLQLAGAKAEVEKLNRLYGNHEDQRGRMHADYTNAGRTIEANEALLPKVEKVAGQVQDLSGDKFIAKADGKEVAIRKEWGAALLAQFKALSDKLTERRTKIGEISGFDVVFSGGMSLGEYRAAINLQTPEPTLLAHDALTDPVGVALRATNALVALSRQPAIMRSLIAEAQTKRDSLVTRLDAPFPFAEQLADKLKEMASFEQQMLSYGKEKTGLEREQEIEDAWAERTGAITPLFSRGTGGGIAVRDLKAVRDRVSAKMKNLPQVHVVESVDDAAVPKALREHIYSVGAQDDVEGATHAGEIYLFASGIKDEARAEFVLAEHEVTHFGLRAVFGSGLDRILQSIWNENAVVRKAAASLRERNSLTSNVAAVEEVLADMPTKDLARLKGWRRLVQSVRDWFDAHGFEKIAQRLNALLAGGLSEQAKADLFVADVVGKARAWVRSGRSAGGVQSGSQLSRAGQQQTPEERADAIIAKAAGTAQPIDAVFKAVTKAVRIDRLTGALYDKAAFLLDRYTPGHVKAGIVADYGVPEAVTDRRVAMQGRMKQQVRSAGELIDKLSTLTREESRVAYEWMNNSDPQSLAFFEAKLPEESIKVMNEVKALVDKLSQEAVALGQLEPEAFKRNRFEYLRRSYQKHTTELTSGEAKSRGRAISIMGDQYKGRGMTDAVSMGKFKNIAPDWWNRKLQDGKADKQMKGEKFIRLERRAPNGEGTIPLVQIHGPGETNPLRKGKLLEVAYWPAGEPMPAKFLTWDKAGTWEVRDTKGGDLIVWRDFTKQEREAMGEIDEARYAIAKTLHGMIHDVETGKYLEWLAHRYAKKDASLVDGVLVEASDRMRDTFAPGEWVQVPDSKIQGTSAKKYGLLAGRYLPGPIWNDVRQTIGGQFKPFGDTYAAILNAWKLSKTALSPAVHTNNVMANLVMADWHDVTAGHVVKALRLILAASDRDGKGAIGRVGNVAARAGSGDREAAKIVMQRFEDSGGNIGTWATAELQKEQLAPLLEALEKEIGTLGQTQAAQVGAMAALQHALHLHLPSAWAAFKPTKAGQALTTEAGNMLSLYEAEDQVFRIAAWLRAKEDGASDLEAGKAARKSFLDYNINAPWAQMARKTVFPFMAFTYRAVPMMLETAARKPWKLMKLGMMAGALNALGYLLSGGDEDDERKLLPEEKSGRIFGVVPKLIRMPWNDGNKSPVFLDIRRFVPVGDIFDTGAGHSAIPLLPAMVPGGPVAVLAEILLNKSQFIGRAIVQDTDTPAEAAGKVFDHLYKAFAPNIVVLPGTYAWTSAANASKGKTDSFGREQSVAQAMASSFGVKLGSYPKDVLEKNAHMKLEFEKMEIEPNISRLKREVQVKGIDYEEFQKKVDVQNQKKRELIEKFQKRVSGG